MKHICILALSNPFAAPYDGGKKDIRSRLDALALMDDLDVDLYILKKPSDSETIIDKTKYNIAHVYEYDMRPIGITLLFSRWPMSIHRRWSREMALELNRHSYDVAIYEGEYMVQYRLSGIVHAAKHIIRMHNIESNYRLELSRSETGLARRAAQYLEDIKYKRLEKSLDTVFDCYLFISCDEQKKFAAAYPACAEKTAWLPTSLERHPIENACVDATEILYYGSLNIANNFLSVKWFIQNVLVLIEKKHQVKLKIVGDISSKNSAELKALSSCVEIYGYVEDLNKAIREASFIISPVLFGSGVKVKLIEALSYGQIIVANTKSIEGTALEHKKHLLVFNEPGKMADACIDIMDHRENYAEMAKNGYQYFLENHTIERQTAILKEAIDG